MSQVTIVTEGKSDWKILCPSPGARGLEFAVSELRKYVRQISGCELESADSASPAIVVGLRADLGESDAALLPEPAKGHDGYALCIAPKRIVIAGDNGHGAIYGVYDLLERMGCRFFYPTHDPHDPEVVPTAPTIAIAAGRRAVAATMPYRVYNSCNWYFEIDPKRAIEAADIAMKQRYNTIGWQCGQTSAPLEQFNDLKAQGVIEELTRRDLWLHGPVHCFNLFLPNTLFDEHPEWFGMRDGKRVKQVYGGSQFCWSNPEARRKLIDNLEEFALAIPELKILCPIGFDGGKACDCPECKKSTPSDLVVIIMNELIERLRASAPHIVVETSGGYSPVHEPPTSVTPDPGLRIVWAHWGRNHSQSGYDDPRYGLIDNLETWRKFVNNQITLCQYYADNFASPWVAAPYIQCMEEDRRYILNKGIDGWYMLIWPKQYWWNHGINAWLGGVFFYDMDLDFWSALRDYAMHYYGPKAGPYMAAYFEQWAREPELAYKVKDDATDYIRAVLEAQREAWIDPAMAAAEDDPIYSYRVAKAEKCHQFAERGAETWFWKQSVQQARAQGLFEEAAELLDAGREHVEETLAWLWRLAALNQGLVDAGEIPGFLGGKLKGWIDEEAKAIADRSTVVEHGPAEMNSMEMIPAETLAQMSDA